MSFIKFKADRLFDGRKFIEDSVLVVHASGVVEAIVPFAEAGDDVQVLSGILSPGLVNCHCHLELSHLAGAIPSGTGLIEFLLSVVTKRDFAPDTIQQKIRDAEQEMYANGIVAVGDICNTVDAVAWKAISKIRWQNFVEVLSISDEKSAANIDQYSKVLKEHIEKLPAPHRSVLTPHSPYTIGKKTFERLNELTESAIISIHNQEHPAEDELYKTGAGEFLRLLKFFGYAASPFSINGISSLRSWLPYFNTPKRILLIHNTYMPEEDVVFAGEYARAHNIELVYCLCPNANLYIEGQLPPAPMFLKNNCHIVLGTDSYSSNWQLSIVAEMQAIRKGFSEIPLETILQWGTLNGAKALDWDEDLGSFDKGKRPGVVLIEEGFGGSRRVL